MSIRNTDDPKKIADAFVQEMERFGYVLDYSLKSLTQEVDRLLESPLFQSMADGANQRIDRKTLDDAQRLEAGIEAYVGETLCRLFDGEWGGGFYSSGFGINFYSSWVQFGDFSVRLSHFLAYRIAHGKQEEGTFGSYLDRILPSINARRELG